MTLFVKQSWWSFLGVESVLAFDYLVSSVAIYFILGRVYIWKKKNLTSIYFWLQRERECARIGGGRGRERGRHRIWSRLQVLRCQHGARLGARTHKPGDHDLSRLKRLNRLSHPGLPEKSRFRFHCSFKWDCLFYFFLLWSLLGHSWNSRKLALCKIHKDFVISFSFERDWVWAGEGQRERETQELKQAPGSELSAQRGTRGSNS